MTKPIEVITSVQRRRRWSRAQKERIVAAAIEPGAVASEVARAAGIHTSSCFGGDRSCAGRRRALRRTRPHLCQYMCCIRFGGPRSASGDVLTSIALREP